MNITELKINQSGKVCSVDILNKKLKTHILEMGLTRGTVVKIVRIAPMGNPICIALRNYELCIRKEEANFIKVEVDK